MPLTIITGFLGSGKTTVLNHILNHCQDLKVAVLVNEFGDINIDSQLLVSMDEDMIELSNGCICCTINEGLVDAVYRVLERDKIDYLVIETTGIADPLPIILTLLGTELRELIHLDSILTLVDAEAFDEDHFDSEAALNQIIYGDIILLNKTDLASEEKLAALEAFIHDCKVAPRILRCQRGEVPLPLILDVGANNPSQYQALLTAEPEGSHDHDHDHDHDHHDHNHHHEHHDHHYDHHSQHLENDGFISYSFQSDRPLSIEKFQSFLDDLPANIFRAKGILWFSESEQKHIFQLSGKRCTITAEPWGNRSRFSQLIIIGRQLDQAALATALKECHALNPATL
ncbi:GTP-binding protein [Spirulina sp. CCNP1310]|uniref:CobW family GTP-binding protein n=1 Tax=Spirulina sp. CCNP1310 TaxID=3110249 RepID=UPI002B20763D|nr:GTP-binding protein [Spirulina sp. CCNP1310]MEA5419151.1 GTP-binding protein [Spirulina sp. CCNP1310]